HCGVYRKGLQEAGYGKRLEQIMERGAGRRPSYAGTPTSAEGSVRHAVERDIVLVPMPDAMTCGQAIEEARKDYEFVTCQPDLGPIPCQRPYSIESRALNPSHGSIGGPNHGEAPCPTSRSHSYLTPPRRWRALSLQLS